MTSLILLAFHENAVLAQCPLVCKGNVNLSIGTTGAANITIYNLMNNPSTACIPFYQIMLTDADNKPVPNPVTCAYIGQTLTFSVTDIQTGNKCWGYLKVEDKLAPTISCQDLSIECNVPNDPLSLGGISVTDNCDSKPTIFSQGEVITAMNCDALPGTPFWTITRTWIAQDKSGNFSKPCTQKITVLKPGLNNIIWPKNYTIANGNALDCAEPDLSPDSLGEPLYSNGLPLILACKIFFTHKDTTLFRCSGTRDILRTWTVLDCCNNNKVTHVQVIQLIDSTPPKVVCPSDFTINTLPGQCVATINLPVPPITDDCTNPDSITVSISGSGFGALGFGPYNNIPPGWYEVNYVICDDCLNCTSCHFAFQVIDNEVPFIICNNNFTIALDSMGMATLSVDSINLQITDNCCLDSIDVKLMGQPDSLFGSFVKFDCELVDTMVMAVLRAQDCNGNVNFCMVLVNVIDTIAPIIQCPNDITINCTVDPDTVTTGIPLALDACGIDSLFFQDSSMLNPCGIGEIRRFWSAIDSSGNISTCIQRVLIRDLTPPLILFPADITISCVLNPDSTLTGFPTVTDDCGIFLIFHSDVIIAQPNACDFIRRTWTVRDICSNVDFTDDQSITLLDFVPPTWVTLPGSLDVTVACDKDVPNTIPVAKDNCSGVVVNVISDTKVNNICLNRYNRLITYRASDRCENNSVPFVVRITVRDTVPPTLMNCPADVTLNLAPDSCSAFLQFPPVTALDNCTDVTISNNSPFANNNGGNISGTYPIGVHVITITVRDACNNQASCTVRITVRDVTPPMANCVGQNLSFLVSIQQKDSLFIITQQFIQQFFTWSDACGPVSFAANPDTFTCQSTGPPPKNFTITLTDASGNITTCMGTVFVVDSFNVCGSMFANGRFIGGQLLNPFGEPFAYHEMTIEQDGTPHSVFTDENGYFMFAHVPDGSHLRITPENKKDFTKEVDLKDFLILLRHQLGQDKISDPYKLSAADVTGDEKINLADLLDIKQQLLGLNIPFEGLKSYKFYRNTDQDFMMKKPLNTLEDYIDIPNVSYHMLLQDFTGMKYGDIDQSSMNGLLNNSNETRDSKAFDLILPDLELKSGEIAWMELSYQSDTELEGILAGLRIDESMSILSTMPMPGTDINHARQSLKLLSTAQTLRAGRHLARVQIQANKDLELKNAIHLDETFNQEGFDQALDKRKINLVFHGKPENKNDTELTMLIGPYPNPFNQTSMWTLSNTAASIAVLEIFATSGQLCLVKQIELNQGNNTIVIDSSELPATGLYQWKISSSEISKTGKLILLK